MLSSHRAIQLEKSQIFINLLHSLKKRFLSNMIKNDKIYISETYMSLTDILFININFG